MEKSATLLFYIQLKGFPGLTDLVEPEILGRRVPAQVHAAAAVAAAAVDVAVAHHSQHLELGHFVRDI